MQSIEDASRMKQIEKDPQRVKVMGNIKFEYLPQYYLLLYNGLLRVGRVHLYY